MKVKKLPKWKLFVSFAVLLTSLFVSFVINSNASAVDFVTELKPTTTYEVTWSAQYKTKWADSWANLNLPAKIPANSDLATSLAATRYVGSIFSRQNISIKQGKYYEIKVAVMSEKKSDQPLGLFWTIQNSTNFRFINMREEVKQIYPTYYWSCSNAEIISGGLCDTADSITDMALYNGQYLLYTITLYALRTVEAPIIIGNTNSISMEIMPPVNGLPLEFTLAPRGTVAEYESVSDEAAEKLEEMNEKDEQDRSDIESQQSDVDGDSDDSQEAAESTGQTLLTAFSGFVTAITSARPSNCKIDMDMGNLDLGLVDLCTLSPPPAFQTLASIFLILFCVPLSIATARKVISLFRSFQG